MKYFKEKILIVSFEIEIWRFMSFNTVFFFVSMYFFFKAENIKFIFGSLFGKGSVFLNVFGFDAHLQKSFEEML